MTYGGWDKSLGGRRSCGPPSPNLLSCWGKVLRTVPGKHSVIITAAATATTCNPSSALWQNMLCWKKISRLFSKQNKNNGNIRRLFVVLFVISSFAGKIFFRSIMLIWKLAVFSLPKQNRVIHALYFRKWKYVFFDWSENLMCWLLWLCYYCFHHLCLYCFFFLYCFLNAPEHFHIFLSAVVSIY